MESTIIMSASQEYDQSVFDAVSGFYQIFNTVMQNFIPLEKQMEKQT